MKNSTKYLVIAMLCFVVMIVIFLSGYDRTVLMGNSNVYIIHVVPEMIGLLFLGLFVRQFICFNMKETMITFIVTVIGLFPLHYLFYRIIPSIETLPLALIIVSPFFFAIYEKPYMLEKKKCNL